MRHAGRGPGCAGSGASRAADCRGILCGANHIDRPTHGFPAYRFQPAALVREKAIGIRRGNGA
jgi:hypothetical protein